MSTCSSTTAPSFPKAYLHSQHPTAPPSPSPSPSPPVALYSRLSNGSLNARLSPTNSRGSFQGVSFLLQIGLTRETVNLDPNDLSLSAVKDLVCSIVDQKVRTYCKTTLTVSTRNHARTHARTTLLSMCVLYTVLCKLMRSGNICCGWGRTL